MSDPRFSALSKDPRYRLPNKKEARTSVDPRFKRLFTDQDFRKKASVDRYGRKVKAGSGKKELEKLYRLDDEKVGQTKGREVIGDEDEDEDEAEEDEAEEESGEEAAGVKRDPAREGGFDESEEEESEEEEDSDEEADLADATAGGEQTESIPMGEVSRRIAAVNLDWDNIRASDIMAVATSFVPSGGRIEGVSVYPSEYGRERLEDEEHNGPPREIFASSKKGAADEDESEEDSESEDERIKKQLQGEQVNEGEEFDTAALRQYQLNRLRYYYAVISCDSQTTAKKLYDLLDGREYLSTANFFDLRFIPDETSFDDDVPRDECKKLPEGYKPNEFRTEALTHSKVRLTWDDDDATRKEVQKRAFSRAEMDENDLQAYIGSDSSGEESDAAQGPSKGDSKQKKKEAERAKMRAALGLGAEPSKSKVSKDEPVGDMQITFTSGLDGPEGSESKSGVFENEPQDEESTRMRYIRKERERKQKRKDRAKAARAGEKLEAGEKETGAAAAEPEEEDQGFDDPFFTDPAAAAEADKKAKKAEKKKERAAKSEKEDDAAARRAELELLMANDQADEVKHFDMREVEKAAKEAKRKGKGKKGRKPSGAEEAVSKADDFKVETEDPRFKALFDSHDYAIDPTNPRFKGTDGMKTLLEEGRKKRKRGADDGEEEERKGKKGMKKGDNDGAKEGGENLEGLVARLKGKGGKTKGKK